MQAQNRQGALTDVTTKTLFIKGGGSVQNHPCSELSHSSTDCIKEARHSFFMRSFIKVWSQIFPEDRFYYTNPKAIWKFCE